MKNKKNNCQKFKFVSSYVYSRITLPYNNVSLYCFHRYKTKSYFNWYLANYYKFLKIIIFLIYMKKIKISYGIVVSLSKLACYCYFFKDLINACEENGNIKFRVPPSIGVIYTDMIRTEPTINHSLLYSLIFFTFV